MDIDNWNKCNSVIGLPRERGVYILYNKGDGEILYIGQGVIKERCGENCLINSPNVSIKHKVILDKEKRFRKESKLISKLNPVYNKSKASSRVKDLIRESSVDIGEYPPDLDKLRKAMKKSKINGLTIEPPIYHNGYTYRIYLNGTGPPEKNWMPCGPYVSRYKTHSKEQVKEMIDIDSLPKEVLRQSYYLKNKGGCDE